MFFFIREGRRSGSIVEHPVFSLTRRKGQFHAQHRSYAHNLSSCEIKA